MPQHGTALRNPHDKQTFDAIGKPPCAPAAVRTEETSSEKVRTGPVKPRIHTQSNKMNLLHIFRETLLMMGFTFVVGIAFAYVLKLMTFLFSCLNGRDLPSILRKSRIWGRAYRMNVAHSYRYIRSIALNDDILKKLPLGTEAGTNPVMKELAEYHFGNPEETTGQDADMRRLYEFHHGKI